MGLGRLMKGPVGVVDAQSPVEIKDTPSFLQKEPDKKEKEGPNND